ncbi:MAG TPA: S8 family serine peptidase [Candidatus Binatia bacterium]|nr:S8 family serine peptidase [Candidatus Binatia bacterium]
MLSWNDKKRPRAALLALIAAGAVVAGVLSSCGESQPDGVTWSALTQVIVRGAPGAQATLDREVEQAGGRVTEHIQLISASVAEVPGSAIGWLSQQPGVEEVTPDGPVQLASASYSPTTTPSSLYSIEQQLGVDSAWQDGYTGAGVGVALIDTGVTPVQGLNGANQVINGPDLSFDNASTPVRYLDANGHGTFMAGIIAGRDPGATPGQYAGDTTDFLGIAPDAHIVNVKVGSANGAVDVSQILAAIDWVVQHRYDNGFNIRVLNLSFGTDSSQSYLLDPLAYAAEVAWQQGLVVVAAAGNQGQASTQLADPAIDPYVIAVGASQPGYAGSFRVAPFSSHGSWSRGPDLVAPGTSLVSLRVPGSVIDYAYGATATVGGRFFLGSGTSQATAVVSGIAALLVQEYPGATPDQIKALLTGTAVPVRNGSPRASGAGEVMTSAAVQAPLPSTSQSFALSTGTGSLEAARGSAHVTLQGVTLSGEQDIFGNAVDTGALATLESYGGAWQGGNWNGATWSGTYYVWGPTLSSWQYVPWTGTDWAGSPWSSVATPSGTWTGVTWSGVTWSGVTWSGVTWSGVTWSGVTWSNALWSTAGWS